MYDVNSLSPWPQDSGWHFAIRRGLRWVFPILHPRHWFRGVNRWFPKAPVAYWFVLDLPALPYPYVSFINDRVHFYAGWKKYGLHHVEYQAWLPAERFGEIACHLSVRGGRLGRS